MTKISGTVRSPRGPSTFSGEVTVNQRGERRARVEIPGCGTATMSASPGSRVYTGTIIMDGEARSIEVRIPSHGSPGSYTIPAAQVDEIYGMPIIRPAVQGEVAADEASCAALSAPAASVQIDDDFDISAICYG